MQFSMDSNMQFPLVDLYLNQGETVFIQRGSMVYHTPNVTLNTQLNAKHQKFPAKLFPFIWEKSSTGLMTVPFWLWMVQLTIPWSASLLARRYLAVKAASSS